MIVILFISMFAMDKIWTINVNLFFSLIPSLLVSLLLLLLPPSSLCSSFLCVLVLFFILCSYYFLHFLVLPTTFLPVSVAEMSSILKWTQTTGNSRKSGGKEIVQEVWLKSHLQFSDINMRTINEKKLVEFYEKQNSENNKTCYCGWVCMFWRKFRLSVPNISFKKESSPHSTTWWTTRASQRSTFPGWSLYFSSDQMSIIV